MLEYEAKDMSWPIQCKLTYLKLRSCLYSEYLLLLLQLPCLKILELEECIMKTENMCTPSSNISFISQLTCLIITNCSVPIEYLRSLILETPKLRHLKLCYQKEIFKSVVDIYDWEKFIRTELNFLDTCEFLVCYKIAPNDKINLQLILAPFLESFWVNEKRWFICYEYVLGHSTIVLYTVPMNFNFYYYGGVCYAISAKINNYHLIQRLHNTIWTDGLKIISLESNEIGDNGARDLALALRNNKTLTTLDLTRNKIGIPGAEYFFESLQSSPVKVSLAENRDSCHLVAEPVSRIKNDQSLTKFSLNKIHFNDMAAKYIADALQKNTVFIFSNHSNIFNRLLYIKTIEELDLTREGP
ncbi:unnamed protein product [Rotaria magnacalcarata]